MRVEAGTSISEEYERIVAPIKTSTGPDGRFRLDGLGRNRVASLSLHGPTTADIHTYAFTFDEPEMRVPRPNWGPDSEFVVHSSRFEITGHPSRPIEGTVRDQETGAPIAGAIVLGTALQSSIPDDNGGVVARTDANGRFHLTGLPVGTSYRLHVKPPTPSLYLSAVHEYKPETATGPLAWDPRMKRGVVVRGRVVDGATGQPVRGWARIDSYEDQLGPDYENIPRGATSQAELDAEGRFAVATVPGPAVVQIGSSNPIHRRAHGYEKIRGYDAESQMIHAGATAFAPATAHAVIEVEAGRGNEAEPLEIRLEPGQTVKVKVADPEGEPIVGTQVRELRDRPYSHYNLTLAPRDEFEVNGLDPSQPRRVVIRHEGRRLAGSVLLKGDEPGPIELRLQPWGTIVGRVVDEGGNPRANIQLKPPTEVLIPQQEDFDLLPPVGRTFDGRLEDDGRFRVEGLVPGLRYTAVARDGHNVKGEVFRDRIIGPGEVVDLGDVKLIDRHDVPGLDFQFGEFRIISGWDEQ
jgi:hypothetical protein